MSPSIQQVDRTGTPTAAFGRRSPRSRAARRPWPRSLAGAIGVLLAAALPAGADDVYAPKPITEVRNEAMSWVGRRGVKDGKTLAEIAEIWKEAGATAVGRDAFDRLIQTFCLVDPNAKRFVDSLNPAHEVGTLPDIDALTRDDSDELFTLHMRLYYARSLTQRLLYDEALTVFARIDPARVVDPATCLFYQAVCQHQLMMKKEALESLDRLMHKTRGVAEPYAGIATLMRDELEPLDERSLGTVSRKMKDSQRRLDLGRGGQRVQKVQSEIIEALDEIIKKAEQQANAQAESGQGENNTNRSGRPADEPTIKGATAPGNVDKKDLKKQGAWGALNPKATADAQQRLNRDFPSNYRQAVEEYFKKLANRPNARGR